jgi:hypothetical protein
MWILKGAFVGVTVFAVGVTVFLLAFFRRSGPIFRGSSGGVASLDINTILHLTTHNVWFWAAFAASIVIGWAVVVSWPGRFSTLFWIMLAIADVVPATLLGLFLMLALPLLRTAANSSAK